MRTVLSLTLPAQGLTPVTCGLALCSGRDSLAFVALPPPPTQHCFPSWAGRPLPARPCCQWLAAPITSPHPRQSQFSTQMWGFVQHSLRAPTAGCGQEISTLAPSSPWDLKQVTASRWASSPLKQAGLVQTLQKALSGADSKRRSRCTFQRPSKWHLFTYLLTYLTYV